METNTRNILTEADDKLHVTNYVDYYDINYVTAGRVIVTSPYDRLSQHCHTTKKKLSK